jgi:hypothetical protein
MICEAIIAHILGLWDKIRSNVGKSISSVGDFLSCESSAAFVVLDGKTGGFSVQRYW